jgi:hypothetical protein
MPRVGSLDNPGYMGKKSVAVYEGRNGLYTILDGVHTKLHGATRWTKLDGGRNGLYTILDGVHTKLHGATRWTKLDGTKMRGASTFGEEAFDEDEAMRMAIAASLQMNNANVEEANAAKPSIEQPLVNQECSIRLTEHICIVLKPCNHCCSCSRCASRLVHHPCPICRVNVTATERIYF